MPVLSLWSKGTFPVGSDTALSPEFTNDHFYAAGTTAGFRKLKRINAVTFALVNNQDTSNMKSYLLNEVKGVRQIIGGFSDGTIHEIRIYNEDLSLGFPVFPQTDQQSLSGYIKIHKEKPILAAGFPLPAVPFHFYRLTELCSSSCQETCVFRKTGLAENCGNCLDGFEEVNGVCKLNCGENEFRELENFECVSCPSCCENGCGFSDLKFSCMKIFEGWKLENGVCVKNEEKEKNETKIFGENFEIEILKLGNFEYEIYFNQGVENFVSENIEILIEDLEQGKDYEYELSKKPNEEKIHTLKIKNKKPSFQTFITIKLKNCQSPSGKFYMDTEKKFLTTKN